jgi:hypothetical protein
VASSLRFFGSMWSQTYDRKVKHGRGPVVVSPLIGRRNDAGRRNGTKGQRPPLKVCGTSEGLVVMPHASAHKVTSPEQSEMMRYNGLAFIGLTLIAFSIADFYVVREGFTANSVIYLVAPFHRLSLH